jgi:hypothetical protein
LPSGLFFVKIQLHIIIVLLTFSSFRENLAIEISLPGNSSDGAQRKTIIYHNSKFAAAPDQNRGGCLDALLYNMNRAKKRGQKKILARLVKKRDILAEKPIFDNFALLF